MLKSQTYTVQCMYTVHCTVPIVFLPTHECVNLKLSYTVQWFVCAMFSLCSDDIDLVDLPSTVMTLLSMLSYPIQWWVCWPTQHSDEYVDLPSTVMSMLTYPIQWWVCMLTYPVQWWVCWPTQYSDEYVNIPSTVMSMLTSLSLISQSRGSTSSMMTPRSSLSRI